MKLIAQALLMSTSYASMAFQAPEVSHADIESFHATHFSNNAVNLFEFEFLRPDATRSSATEEYYYKEEEEEDDGLGYYPDGVKRTLTDEQIAIFRHSEIEALRRADRAASNQEATHDSEPAIDPVGREPVHTPMENGVVSTDSANGSEDGEMRQRSQS
ncbi:hypothetical protein RRF57_007372 [Xylaria bambusicola]|uniref:Uncharacterized protein n=1 Tax=Xylaria bambusicola TaxID=326684 RepID=A0AAN7ZAH9_9PEZI